MKIKYRDLSLLGLFIYLCAIYLGNTERIIGFGMFILLSLPQFYMKRHNQYAKWQFAFCAYLCLSYLWSHKGLMNTTVATLEILIPISALYCEMFLFAFIQKEEDIRTIVHVFFASLVFLILYLVAVTPLSVWGTMAIGQNVGLHKNSIGLNTAWGSVICFYYIRETVRKKKTYIALFVVFSMVCLVAGSRKALVILLGGIALYYVLCEKNVKLLKNIGIAIGVVLIVWLMVMNIPVLYKQVGERTAKMVETLFRSASVSITEDKSIWERSYYRRYAMQMFMESPLYAIFGHGLDGFRTRMAEIGYYHVAYSHCNYTELLANYGILGFLLYYFIKVKTVVKTFLQKDRPKIVTLFMIVLGLGIVIEYGVVSYYDEFIQFNFALSYCVIMKTKAIGQAPAVL